MLYAIWGAPCRKGPTHHFRKRQNKTTENDFDVVFCHYYSKGTRCICKRPENGVKVVFCSFFFNFLSFSQVARWALSIRRPSNRMLHVAVLPQWNSALMVTAKPYGTVPQLHHHSSPPISIPGSLSWFFYIYSILKSLLDSLHPSKPSPPSCKSSIHSCGSDISKLSWICRYLYIADANFKI